MNKLIQEISSIVSQYGTDIVIEERFVNILKDLYPDRDHPEKFEILKAIIAESISADMYTDCDATTAKSFLEKKAQFLYRKYGYDSGDIKQVLACLCIGSGFITIDDYYATTTLNRIKPSPQKNPNPAKPKAQNNPSPTKPTPKKKSKDPLDLLSLIWSLVGLLVAPFIYLGLLTSGWWPFWALSAVLFILLITIIPAINQNQKATASSPIVGGITAVVLCAAIFLTVAPFFTYWTRHTFDFCHLYYGFDVNEAPTILTFIGGLAFSFVFSTFINTTNISHFSCKVIYNRNPSKFWLGFCATLAVIFAVTVISFHLPDNDKHQEQLRYEDDKYNLEQEKQRIANLKDTRSKEDKVLSFMDFTLGGNFKEAVKLIRNKKSQYQLDPDDSSQPLYLNEINYTPIVDDAVSVTTDWDNELVYLYLYSNNNRIIAIEMKTDHKTDSLVSIYSNKYGEAEHISDLDYSKYKYIKRHANENDLDSLFGESVVYTWTFKNAIVQISGHRKTESLGIYDEGYKSVLYFDNECNALLDKYRARVRALRQEQEKKENAEAQRIKDSVWQAVQKERLEKKQNHEKSIKQI